MSASFPRDLASHVGAQLVERHESPPPVDVLTELFETLFFASLKQEEGQAISCRVAFISRHRPDPHAPARIVADRWRHFPLSPALPMTVQNLVKLSTAVDPWGSTLAVDADSKGKLWIWGLIDQSVHYSAYIVKESSVGPEMPGMFQAAIQGNGEIAVYKTYVFLGGLKQDTLTRAQRRVFHSGPVHSKLVRSIKRFQHLVRERVGSDIYDERGHWDQSLENLWISSVCRILIGIQRYHHGGAVLLSDGAAGLNPKYTLEYDRLADALVRSAVLSMLRASYSDHIRGTPEKGRSGAIPADLYLGESSTGNELGETESEVTGCIRFITSLSRVDGLIWLDTSLRLQAFGVEIMSHDDPREAFIARNSAATKTTKLDLNQFGTRHRSMLRYCDKNADSVGFVVSQDGDVRAITKFNDHVFLWQNVRIQSLLNARVVRES